VVSSDELRRYGYQWFLLDVAFGKPKGWAAGRLERMWMAQGEGGQRLFNSCVATRHRFNGWKLRDRRSVDSAHARAAGNRFGERILAFPYVGI
jgi:hypothetical protein